MVILSILRGLFVSLSFFHTKSVTLSEPFRYSYARKFATDQLKPKSVVTALGMSNSIAFISESFLIIVWIRIEHQHKPATSPAIWRNSKGHCPTS